MSLADGRQQATEVPVPIDLTIEVTDHSGMQARLPLSHFMLLQPQLRADLGKARVLSPFPASEVVLQHFEFPLRDFLSENPAFQPADLSKIRLVFDRTPAGIIVLDDIGFRRQE